MVIHSDHRLFCLELDTVVDEIHPVSDLQAKRSALTEPPPESAIQDRFILAGKSLDCVVRVQVEEGAATGPRRKCGT